MYVHGEWLLTPECAAVHVPTATAVIADVHLGYDRARLECGESVPAIGLADVVARLAALFARHLPRRLVIAGDLVENHAGYGLTDGFMNWLASADVELTAVVPGNHDQRLPSSNLPLVASADGFALGRWRVLHGDGPSPSGRALLGHFHPCFRWHGLRAPCFLVGRHRLILPAFSADAAGVNVVGDPRWKAYRCCVAAGGQVLDFGVLGRLDKARRRKTPGRLRRDTGPGAQKTGAKGAT
jgi:putative SbcD/Mre11-related phosphoesterase